MTWIRTISSLVSPQRHSSREYSTLWITFPKSSGQSVHEKPVIASFLTSQFSPCPYDRMDSRVVWQYLHRKVHHYFPEIALKVVGGSLFLRFFCPAILSPHWFGLVEGGPPCHSPPGFGYGVTHSVLEPPSPEAQRHLTLVTKTIQNIANGMRFGKKEAYMGSLHASSYPLAL